MVTDVSALSACVNLTRVSVEGCLRLTTLDGLAGLPLLHYVDASNTPITRLDALTSCPRLRTVKVVNCPHLQSFDRLREANIDVVQRDFLP
ncbi:hypothetical protein AGDE_16408 [Angomonas deanei]|uniref:Leucine Rich repeat n=1 Tax=Angomonas deanei TaxID=59799 RepID=A0A7G2CN73_9TRYP|nr:hypothetical protein AGDE_16408 [Angomonas deanei]CAD2221298.1 hypothetical protein, conserved [Angomonas deanei]|eukprot:EPY17133.1 hypothetical protein AGDE_16408 [Angomonas deanei]